jgi:hypothetical protein
LYIELEVDNPNQDTHMNFIDVLSRLTLNGYYIYIMRRTSNINYEAKLKNKGFFSVFRRPSVLVIANATDNKIVIHNRGKNRQQCYDISNTIGATLELFGFTVISQALFIGSM